MKLTLTRYRFILIFQFTFLLADLLFNSFAHLFTLQRLQASILIFLTQDVLIICEYLLFTFVVHATCVYEIGATHIILRNSKLFIITILMYFILSCAQHVWIVYNIMWYTSKNWPLTLKALAFIQRAVSLCYYYIYKRTALTLADPRYYAENIDWIAEQLNNK